MDGGTLWGFRKRNLAEGVVLGAVGVVLSFLLPVHGTARLSATIFMFFAPCLLGAVGIMGDPLSVFAGNAIKWVRHRGPMLFNHTPRLLEVSPTEAALDNDKARMVLAQKLEALKTKFQTSEAGISMVEGEDYEFMEDRDEAYLIAEQYDGASEVMEVEFEDESAMDMQHVAHTPHKQETTPELTACPDLSALETEGLY